MLKRIILSIVCSIIVTSNLYALNFVKPPSGDNFVIDKAKLLDLRAVKQLNKMAQNLFKEKKIPLYIVTINSISQYGAGDMSPDDYAMQLFNKWQIGHKKYNYGMLLFLSVEDRRVRIQLGASWEPKYNMVVGEIIHKIIIPNFRNGDFIEGVIDGATSLDAMARGEPLPAPPVGTSSNAGPTLTMKLIALAAFGLFAFMVYNLFKSGRKGWAWALIIAFGILLIFLLKTGASRGGGLGGGFSGGGGAGGSW
jgi:uncharacterized protein